ncbi:DUF2723 domain-containing protein [Candidatus Fermentibacterales bacterium]|nr:DUF2723 domain-containing protein [Candidatus Fermentibacterales bacterium]
MENHERTREAPGSSVSGPVRRKDRISALSTAMVAAVVYLLTIAPSVSFWDSGEYITCSYIAGIPHPPGVPMFVLMGRFFTILLSFVPVVALRVNLMCAFAGVGSIFLVTRLVQRWASRMGFGPGVYRPMSVLAGLMSTLSYTIWRNNNATETYALAHLFSLLILWVFDLWLVRRLERRKGGRQLLLVGYLVVLSVANHLSALIVVPPIVLMALLYSFRGHTRFLRDGRFLCLMLGLAVIAFSVHLYMPLRAVQRPEINETDPSRWPAFREALERKQYGTVSLLDRKGPFPEQLMMYARFLSWQSGRPEAWQELLGDAGQIMSFLLRFLVTAGAIYSLVVLARKRRDLLVLIGFTFLMASFFFVVYLNFKTGPVASELGEVRERDYFFGASFAFFSILAAIGLTAFVQDTLRVRKSRLLYCLLLVPAIYLPVNYHRCDRSGDYVAHDYGVNLLETCTEGAVLITNGDNDTFPLWFAQGVLGVRRDVIVSNLSLMNTTWYVRQLLDRDPDLLNFDDPGYQVVDSLKPVFVWGPNFFHVTEEGYPYVVAEAGRALRAAFDQAWPWGLSRDSLAISVPNDGMGMQGSIGMQDLVLLDMIREQPTHGRDVFLAATVSQENRAYVRDYMLMEGIAFRVVPRRVVDDVNTERGWELLNDYFYRGLDDPGVYKDDQACQLVRNYVSAYHRLAYEYISRNDGERARQCCDLSMALLETMPEVRRDVLAASTLVRSRVTDGLEGPAAAAESTLATAAWFSAQAEITGDRNLSALAAGLQQLANEYRQEQSFRTFMDSLGDSLDCERSALLWLSIEVDLAFGNYISAQTRLEQGPVDAYPQGHDALLRSMMETELQDYLKTTAIDHRFNLGQGAVAMYLELTDTSSVRAVLTAMAEQVSAGRIVAAAAGGLVVAASMQAERAPEAQLVRDYAYSVLEEGRESRERAIWLYLAVNRDMGEEAAYELLLAGEEELAYLALSGSTAPGVSEALEAILRDPESYSGGLPDPRDVRAVSTGPYGWVRALSEGV